MIFSSVSNKLFLSIKYICAIVVLVMIVSVLKLNRYELKLINLLFIIFITLLLSFIAVKINRHSTKFFLITLALMSMLTYLIWNIYARTYPISDYKVLLEGANNIVEGTFHKESFDKTSYFYFYNYQIGYTVYLSYIMRIFGNNLIWFKLLEGIYLTLTSMTIYKITEKLSTKDAAAIASLIYVLYIPNIMGASIINNQHISSLLLCLALYFILKSTKVSLSIAGVLLGFTQILRPITSIAIIALFISCFYKAIDERKYKEYVRLFAIFIISFMFVIKAFDIAVVKTGISPSPISKSNAKYFKFVLGLKDSGVYNIPTENARKTQVYFDLKTLDFDYDKYNDKCLEVIKDSIKNYKDTIPLIKKKMHDFMGEKDNGYYFALSEDKMNNGIEYFLKLGNIQYLFMLLGTFILLMNKSNWDNSNNFIFYVLIIGFVSAHIFIEAQTRYRYEIYIFTAILSGECVEIFKLKYNLFKKKLSLHKFLKN